MKYSQWKCAWPSPWSLEWVKAKCKYVNRNLICEFLCDGNCNASSTCHRFTEIFANKKKCQKFDLENESPCERGEKRNRHYSTGNIPFYIAVFFRIWEFQNLSYPAIYVYGKGGKRSIIFGIIDDGHWRLCCRILIIFEFVDYLLPLTLGVFFKNIGAS